MIGAAPNSSAKRRRIVGSAPVHEKIDCSSSPIENRVLRRVQILELVHQQVVPARRDALRDIGVAVEQLRRARDEVVEVQHVAGPQVRDVGLEGPLVTAAQCERLEAVAGEQQQDLTGPLLPHADAAKHQSLVSRAPARGRRTARAACLG
jgi:hypothetical protein